MTALHFDRRQYLVLVQLLGELGSRRELTSQLGLDASALGYIRYLLMFMGGLASLAVLGHPAAHSFEFGMLGMTMLFLVPMMVSEATDAFMNPAEATVLAPRPIRGSTYLAAKATYVMRAALMIALPFNAIPAVAGLWLPGAGWLFPLTHLLAAATTGIFTALLACGVFGVLFRIVPIASLRTAALWSQMAAMLIGPLAPQLMSLAGRRAVIDFNARYWSAVPISWFAALGLIGQPGARAVEWSLATPTAIVCLAIVGAGTTALSQRYMTRVVMLMRIRRARPSRAERGWRRSLSAHLPGTPGARAGAAFTIRMALRDWQFRRAFLQSHMALVVMTGVAIARAGLGSPFGVDKAFAPVQMVPHLNGIVIASACLLLPYSDHYKAAWLFLIAPRRSLLGFSRGMFWALWCAGILTPHAILWLVGVWRWGWPDGSLFAAYSLAVASSYLAAGLWFAGGLPFVKAPKPGRTPQSQSIMMALMVCAGVLMVIQNFVIFRSRGATMIAIPVVALCAAAMAWASLRVLAVHVRTSLDALTASPSRMFAASTRDDG